MQSKISSFFKTHQNPPQISDQINNNGDIFPKSEHSEALITYKRRDPKPNSNSDDDDEFQSDGIEMEKLNQSSEDIDEANGRSTSTSLESGYFGRVPNKKKKKKRSYTQFHLELGQSDFLLHACSVCGLMYARGDAGDEKVHKAFHREYYQGIQFKGWCNERVVFGCSTDVDRIVLVLDGDSPKKKHKVQQVVNVMEKELGFDGASLVHKLCQVYLFVSNHRIVGCLIAEPIKMAHKVIFNSSLCENFNGTRTNFASPKTEKTASDAKIPCSSSLRFGDIKFRRETTRKCSTNRPKINQCDNGAILCEEEAVPAICGVRAIWVVPCNRRNRVASKLLDAARKSFCSGKELDPSQCAFSSPTTAGKAFASSYSGSKSFLIYKMQEV